MRAVHPPSATGRRAVVRPDNSVALEDFEVRPPGPGEVLIETVSTLISAGTELGSQEQRRDHATSSPATPTPG